MALNDKIKNLFGGRKELRYGFTLVNLKGNKLGISHNGNMGNTIENSVNPNLNKLKLPTINQLKKLYKVTIEKGSPDYQYYIK